MWVEYCLYYFCLFVILAVLGFVTGVLGLLTIAGFGFVADFLNISESPGVILFDNISLLGLVILYIISQYGGIRILYKETVKDMEIRIKNLEEVKYDNKDIC